MILTNLKNRVAAFFAPQAAPQPAVLPASMLRGQEISYTDSFLYGGTAPTPYNPDDLVQRKGIPIYRDMLKDPQVRAALTLKKLAVLSAGFEIVEPEISLENEAAKEKAREQKSFLEFNFGEMTGGVESKLRSMLSALDFGFSVSELIFAGITYGPFTGKIGLRDIKTRKPDGFDFFTDGKSNLLPDGICQSGARLPPEKFLLFSYNDDFGNFYGTADLRSVYTAWWSKQNITRFMTIGLERHGIPTMVFTSEGVLTDTQKATLQNLIDNIQAKTGIIIPKGVTFELKEPQRGAGDVFVPVLKWLDSQITTGLLVPGLMGLSGEQQTGSLARSGTEFDIFMLIIGSLRRELEVLLNERVCKPLLDLNFEISDGKYSRFQFRTMTDAQRQQLFELWLKAIQSGAAMQRPEDENRLRSVAGMDPLTDEEIENRKLDAEERADAEVEKSNLDIADRTQAQIQKMERRLYGRTLDEVMTERTRAGVKRYNGSVGFKENDRKP